MEEFVDLLKSIPWFSNLGKSTSVSTLYKQIHSWEEWPGPQDQEVCEISIRQQAYYDSFLEYSNQHRRSLEQLWETIQDVVVQVAGRAVPYDAEKDSHYAPNLAVWHAGWTAGLVGLCLALKTPIPGELQVHWTCFVSGHWPCAWEGDFPEGQLIIY
jgi:hypothetical protein